MITRFLLLILLYSFLATAWTFRSGRRCNNRWFRTH